MSAPPPPTLGQISEALKSLNNLIVELTSDNVLEMTKVRTVKQIFVINEMMDRLKDKLSNSETTANVQLHQLERSKHFAKITAAGNATMVVLDCGVVLITHVVWNKYMALGFGLLGLVNFYCAARSSFVVISLALEIRQVQTALADIEKLREMRHQLQSQFDQQTRQIWKILEEKAAAADGVVK